MNKDDESLNKFFSPSTSSISMYYVLNIKINYDFRAYCTLLIIDMNELYVKSLE